MKTLAADCRWSSDKVNRVKTSLIKKGLIDSKPRFKPNSPGQTSNLYTILTTGVQNYTPTANLQGGGVQECTGGDSKPAGAPGGKSEGEPPAPVSDEVLVTEVLTNEELTNEELERRKSKKAFFKSLVYKHLIDCLYPQYEKYADYYLGFNDFSDELERRIDDVEDETVKAFLEKLWGAAENLLQAFEEIKRPRPEFRDFEVFREDKKPKALDEAEYQIKAYIDYCRLSGRYLTTDPEKLPSKLIECDWVFKLHELVKPQIMNWNYDPIYDHELQSNWLIDLYYWELLYDGFVCKRRENRIVYAGEEYRSINSHYENSWPEKKSREMYKRPFTQKLIFGQMSTLNL